MENQHTKSDIVREKYLLRRVLGRGKFGEVLQGVDIHTGELVAIKREPTESTYSSIKHEVRIMTYLFQQCTKMRHKKSLYTPLVYWYGVENAYNYLIMSYYELSLMDYLLSTSGYLDMRIVFMKCIRILKTIHEAFVIHRDIKPENFMVNPSTGEIYLIDFGLATFWIDADGEHIENTEQTTITGTPKYVSYYNHIGNTISRRDDLISLGYMFMGILHGYLPWEGKTEDQRIHYKSWDVLSEILDPLEEEEEDEDQWLFYYMKYCYQLEFEEIPEYDTAIFLTNDSFIAYK